MFFAKVQILSNSRCQTHYFFMSIEKFNTLAFLALLDNKGQNLIFPS